MIIITIIKIQKDMTTNFYKQIVNQVSNAKGVVLTLMAAVCLLFAFSQGAEAETRTVTYNPTSQITWAQWQSYNSNNTYVTLTSDNTPTVHSDGTLRIAGTTNGSAKKVTFTLVDT